MALSLADRLKQHVKVTADYKEKNPTETIDVIVTRIVPTQQVRKMKNGTEMRVMQVITKEHGNFFPLEEAVTNMVSNFGDGVKAKLTFRANNYKDASGAEVEGLTCTSVVLNALDTDKEAMIKALPKGAALFAL